jgi:hypothetical protein
VGVKEIEHHNAQTGRIGKGKAYTPCLFTSCIKTDLQNVPNALTMPLGHAMFSLASSRQS